MSVRKPHLPLLIDAFPVPPSHIPLTPSSTSFFNPPPSGPPSTPLPPVPGPSKITDADTLQLLLLSSRTNRSRRSSKYSVATGENNRDSLISTASAHSYGPVSPSPRPSPRLPPPSNRSSTASSGSMPTSPISRSRPSITFSIDEEHDELKPAPMPRNAVSPLPLFDEDDVDHSPRRRRRHQANDSISSIDVRDILGATSGGEDDDLPASKPIPLRLASSHSRNSSLAYLNPEPARPQPPSHSRTPSMSSKRSVALSDVASSSTITIRSPAAPISPPKTPGREATLGSLPPRRPPPISTVRDTRSPSPDIDSIIQSTPKPAKLSVARSFSLTQEKRKQLNSVRSVKSMRSMRGAVDEFGALATPMRLSKSTIGRKKSTALDPDDSLDYIVSGVWGQSQGEDEEEKRVRQLEKVLDGSGSDSDDSSLDLHTPLPHLMVRDGLLSPNSKLLPGSQSRSTTPYAAAPDGRPGSTMSTFSSVSKSGVMKDERDTPSRRVRHRDGGLLRGGVGLTTGLGWSDSEDEDAPSPLTKRLSTLNLTARSSISSLSSKPTQAPHPLSRSYSSGTLYDAFDEDDRRDGNQVNEWGHRSTSNPPTSWSRKMSTHSASTRTSFASSGGRLSIASSSGRMSVASTGSAFSLEAGNPDSCGESHNRRSGDGIRTPSSGSTLSIPLPVTPQHEPHSPSEMVKSVNGKKIYLNKDKSLPPLPGGLKKAPSRPNLATSTQATPSQRSFPRARTFSSTSSNTSTPTTNAPQSVVPSVRPLQLPRQIRTGDRSPVPVPSAGSRAMRKASLPSNPITPSPALTPSRSLSTSDKPRPRTGTGMVYKTSSSSSKLRPPMPSNSTSLATSSIGRPRPLVKPAPI